jgi:Ca2+-binding RTX toxin-like protein
LVAFLQRRTFAGDGDDTIVTHLGEGNDIISGGAGNDVLDIRSGVFDGLDGEDVNFFFETTSMQVGMNVLAFHNEEDSSLQLVFREILPDGGGVNDLSKIKVDLADGGVETIRIGGKDFATNDILDGALSHHGMSMEVDSSVPVVDRLEEALDEALDGGGSSGFYTSEVAGAVAETMDYAHQDDVIDPLA